MPWVQAVEYCQNLDSFGFDDWRLPNPRELSTIVHAGDWAPSINEAVFPNTSADVDWTWTSREDGSSLAWGVSFSSDGPVDPISKTRERQARCVRGPARLSLALHRSIEVESEPVTRDIATGLMWQGCSAGQSGDECEQGGGASSMDWRDALSHCQSLVWAGYDDWRLPDRNELQSIVIYGDGPLVIDVASFPNTPASDFWSSTSVARTPEHAWVVDLGSGRVRSTGYSLLSSDKHGAMRVRCVRGGVGR